MGAKRKKFIIGLALLGVLSISAVSMKAEGIDAYVSSTSVELVSDGSAPFDRDTGPGKDNSPNNGIVRSFDEVLYDLMFILDGEDNEKLYDVEITAELPDINTDAKQQVEWDITGLPQAGMQLLKGGSLLKFTLNDIRIGQLNTKSLRANIHSINNGVTLQPTFRVNIKGDEDINASVAQCNSTVVSSVKHNLDIALHHTGNRPKGEVNGQLGRIIPIGIDMKALGNAETFGRGSGFPEGDIEFDLSMKGADKRTSLYDTCMMGEADKDGTETFIYYMVAASKLPIHPSGRVHDEGNMEITQLNDITYHVKIKDYKVGKHFPIHYRNTTGTPTPDFTPENKYFGSYFMEVFVPFSDRYSTFKLTPEISNIRYSFSDGSTMTSDVDNTNDKYTIDIVKDIQHNYGMHNHTFKCKWDALDRPNWNGGNARVYKNNYEFLSTSFIWGNGHNSPLEAMQGGAQLMTFIQGDKVEVIKPPEFTLGNCNRDTVKTFKAWYGVGKLTKSEILDTRTSPKRLEWFASLEEAKAAERPEQGKYIFGIATDTTDSLWGTDDAQLQQNSFLRVRKNNVQDFEAIVTKSRGTVFRDKERRDKSTVNNTYKPAEYLTDGSIKANTHIPNYGGGGGSTFQVIPYFTSVTSTCKNNDGVLIDGINVLKDREMNWTLQPKLEGLDENSTNDIITVKHVIPKEELLIDGSTNRQPSRVSGLPDGSTELAWDLNVDKSNNSLPALTFKSKVKLGTTDKIKLNHISSVHSRGDVRGEEYFRQNKKSIEVVSDANVFINEKVNKVIESGDIIKYDLILGNNSSKKDFNNCKILNILPYNGDALKSDYKGELSLNKINLPAGVTAQYTDIPSTEIKRDMSNLNDIPWKTYNGDKVNATAILLTCPNVVKATEYPVSVELGTQGNRHGNNYVNQSYAKIDGLDFKISSEVARTTVTSRDIIGTIWLDKDSNGLDDDVSSKVNKAKVTLVDSNGKDLRSVNTDENGKYTIMDVRPGNYKLRFEDVGKNLMPTKVVDDTNGNTVKNDNLLTDEFNLKAEDLEKRINLGMISALSLSKKCNTEITYPGGEIEYVIDIRNNSSRITKDIEVVDELSETLTAVEESISDDGKYNKDDNMINWNIGQLTGNSNKELKFKCTISKDVKGEISNIAYLKEYKDTTSGVSNTSQVKTLSYNLKSDKAEENLLKAGDNILYTLSVTNPSGQVAKGINIKSKVPEGLTLVNESISDGGTYTEGSIEWSLDVEPNTTKDITYSTNVKLPNKSVEEVNNKFTVNGVESNEVKNIIGKANIEIDIKADQTNVTEDGKLKYNVKITNHGNVDSEELVYTAENAPGTQFIPESLPQELTDGKLIKTIGVLKPNEVIELTYEVTVDDVSRELNEFEIKHEAKVNDKYLGDITSNVESTKVLLPRIEAHQSVNTSELCTVGNELIYTINVSNTGEAKEKNIHIESVLPDNVELLEQSSKGTLNEGKLVWDLGELPKDKDLEVSYKVRLTKGEGTYWKVNCNSTVNSKEINKLSNAVAVGDLKYLMRVDQEHATVGDILTYSIDLYNEGDYPLRDLKVIATKPEGVKIVGDSEWTVDTLKARSKKTLTFKCKILDLKEDITKAWLNSNADINGVKSNDVYTEVTIGKLNYNKTCSVDENNIIPVGENVDYTINISNTGDRVLEDITIEEKLPDHAELVNVEDGKKKLFQNELKWNIDKLEPHETKSFKYTIRTVSFPSSNADNWEINSESLINGKPSLNNTVQVGVPRIKIVNEVAKDKVMEKEILDMKIKATNSGAVASKEFTVKTDLGDSVEFIPEQNKDVEFDKDKNQISWQLDKLDKGQTKDINVKVKVKELSKDEYEGNINIKNKIEGDLASISTSDLNVDIIKPKLAFKKEVNSVGNISVNDTITYSIKVKNEGSAVCDKVEIKDSIPKGTTLLNGDTVKIIEALKPGAEDSLKFSVKVNPNEEEQKWKIINTASVNGENTNTTETIARYFKTDNKGIGEHVTDTIDKVVGWAVKGEQESDDWKKEYEFNAGGKSSESSTTNLGIDEPSSNSKETVYKDTSNSKDNIDTKKLNIGETLPKLNKLKETILPKTGTGKLIMASIPITICCVAGILYKRKN